MGSLAKFLGSEQYCRVVRLLPHFDEPDIVFGNIGGITLTVPDNLWQEVADGPRPAPPGDWHVLVMGTRKSIDREGRVVGQDMAKLSPAEFGLHPPHCANCFPWKFRTDIQRFEEATA